MRLLAGEDRPWRGGLRVEGRVGYMPQFIGSLGGTTTVRDLLLSLAPDAVRRAGAVLAQAEEAVRLPHGSAADMRYAEALAGWSEAGGYEAEVMWDICTNAALARPFDTAGSRLVRELSGGEQKRLALEALFRSDADVLLLDEPDNFLDVRSKLALERALRETDKTVLYVSHDREFLAATSDRVVTLEGHGCWTHEGSFTTYHDARQDRLSRLDEQHRRHREEHQHLVEMVKEFRRRATMSDAYAARYKAAQSRLRRFESERPPPERPQEQHVRMRLGGGRTGNRALAVRGLEIAGIVGPFETEVMFGERVAVVGPNGAGKSHFLRLLAGEQVAHAGSAVLGARVVPGYFSQTHDRPDLFGLRVHEILAARGLDRAGAMRALRRYELSDAYDQPFATLSGGQQARVQILLLELSGSTMLLLDEPTDNLDIASAEALEDALDEYNGTVLASTHDRWFMRSFDRFLVFGAGGTVHESLEPAL